MTTTTVIAKANPNRHGRIELLRFTDTGFETEAEHEHVFAVRTIGDDRGDETEFDTEEEARAYFDAEVAHWAKEPNWEAQAAYDAEWGTDNGYGRHQIGQEY